MSAARKRRTSEAEEILGPEDVTLLDVVDNVLSKGVVLSGDLTLALAHVDLVYVRLSLLLCAADRVLPHEDEDFLVRHSARRAARLRSASMRAPGRSEIRTPAASGSVVRRGSRV